MSLGFNNIMSVAGGILGGAQSPGTVTYTNSRCIARFLPFQTRDLSATIPTLEDVQTPDESLTVEKKLILTLNFLPSSFTSVISLAFSKAFFWSLLSQSSANFFTSSSLTMGSSFNSTS